MTPYSPADTFHANVSNFELTDLVLGGPSGPDNVPVKELADNALYLYNRLGRFDGVHVLNTGNVGNLIDRSVRLKLLYVNSSSNLTFTIDDIANFQDGDRLTFKVQCTPNKSVSFLFTGGQGAVDGLAATTKISCHDGDEFELVIYNGSFLFMPIRGNWDKVAQDAMVRVVPKNAVIGQGQLANRADYARIFDFVSANSLLISDATWSSALANMANFSDGNGTTTFRFPDMRAMTWRGLDLGRGMRLGNTGSNPGNYEDDAVGPHKHDVTIPYAQHTTSNANIGVTDGPPSGSLPNRTYLSDFPKVGAGMGTVATETRVKNIGLIPVIFY